MKEQDTKSVKISKKVHKKLKLHVADKEEGITPFLDRAIENQIKAEKTEKRIMASK